ncbi:tetratricopeptide repeat protein [Brevibacillus fulvus]|uniref:Tetratricopeptide (TPR) repeat protein n=1 Tax=Brevibacillus fulvus TaxID=1125967 RepID=A0A938Y071_9BACL|nr:tetratricopeptide repeat protein [Brevibacillus fulvus]MBM7588730.1 tetratricopeptide (TPR) repeat protein [Brevibacillus fulvus]
MTKQWLYVIDEAVKRIENDEIELGLQALQKVQEHGKDLPEVMLYLADVWYQLGHLDSASDLLNDLLSRTDAMNRTMRQECQLLLAEVLLDGNQLDQAETILYELKEEGYAGIDLNLLLADLYSLQGLDEVALRYVEAAREMEPENESIAAALGNLYVRVGRTEEALALLEEAGVSSLEALLFKARTLAQKGEFEQAYQTYRQALEIERSPELLFNTGMMAFHLGHLQEAETMIETLLAIDEEYLAAYSLLADIHLSLGKTDKAIVTLEKYVDLSGFDLEQLKRLTALLTQAGRYEEAKKYQKLLDDWSADEEE